MDTQYLVIATQYYLAGRSATFAYSLPVAGNLFHHAVEMLLKSILIKSYSGDQLKNKFSHDLQKLWDEFGKIANDSSLSKFDDLITSLNDIEDLRYPGKGYGISISIYKSKLPEFSGEYMPTKQYYACLEDIDEFVSAILRNRINPEWIKGLMMHGNALDQYKMDNKHPFF